MIKSENGRLRAYVQLQRPRPRRGRVRRGGAARRRDEKVEAAARACTSSGPAPSSTRSGPGKTLQLVFPAVIAVIVLILYLTLQERGSTRC